MTSLEVVRAGWPEAKERIAEFILWCRTPFPVAHVSEKDLYKAANRNFRAMKKGRHICEFCDRIATKGELCEACDAVLNRKEQTP